MRRSINYRPQPANRWCWISREPLQPGWCWRSGRPGAASES